MNDCYRFIAMNSTVDVAFRCVPKIIKDGTTYMNMWRVEGYNLLLWQKKGKFHKGDSYLIVKLRADCGHTSRYIHFWLGSETTQDEAGLAALKAVELDDYFGGQAVQFREVENYESKIFLSYFSTITYESGGYLFDLYSIKQHYEEKLWHVKGKRNLKLNQLPMGWCNVNNNDVYILDIKECMFIWIGKRANVYEKIKAAQITQYLNTQRVSKVQVIIVNDGEEGKLKKDEFQLFNRYLPLAMKNLGKHEQISDDSENENFEKALRLYICCDEDGVLKVTELKNGPLSYSDLQSKDMYIIVSEDHVWIWVGRLVPKTARREAMNNAVGFSKKKNADLCQVIRVIENEETEDFKYLFHNWPEPSRRGNSKIKIGRTIQSSYDAKSLHDNKPLAAELQMVDDGQGEVEVHRFQNYNLIPVTKQQFGQFFNGDCYVIVYTYTVKTQEKYIVYYWLGIESNLEDQRVVSLRVTELEETLGHNVMQVRVIQGKEPPHLMTIFKGKMVILLGSHEKWEKKSSLLASGPGRHYMLHVRGTSDYNTKAVQVPMRAASLNSNDVFVIFDGHRCFIWAGKGSTGDEREMAKNISDGATFIPEGHEKPEFWNCLGGFEPYMNDKQIQNLSAEHRPRLFCFSKISEPMKVEEIYNFEQKDLIPDDIMLIDTWDSIFLWIGNDVRHDDKKQANTLILQYLENDPAFRHTDIPIYRVYQGYEPAIFSGFFTDWNESFWENDTTFEQLEKQLKLNNMNVPLFEVPSAKHSGQTFKQVPKYAYSMLAGRSPDMLPSEVDPSNKEATTSN
ncbi:advillin-like isoform X2 [Octopus vulgaris]|uniref:Advillin-like isoform X2 n=1 Tax=Octopus vulgaris TaxID=6645 RepID=A0AA36ALQ0_OCTVU|nr:advillin-like isoform X2 [Octopus vulgaris]